MSFGNKKNNYYWKIFCKATALNKAVKVRRLSAARLHKTVFGLRPLHGFVPPHFFAPEKLLRSFLIGRKKTSFTAGRYAQVCNG